MDSSRADNTAAVPHRDVWFHIKYWGYILPIAYIASILYVLVPLSGVFVTVQDYNIDECVKMEGPSDFKYCEDFVLSNEPGVAYVSCDPVRIQYNDIMGIDKLTPGEAVPAGAIWKVNYAETPASIDRFNMQIQSNIWANFHPLGVALDVHPESNEKTLAAINKPHHGHPSVEFFRVDDDQITLIHKHTVQHPKIYSPNGIHVVQDVRLRSQDGIPSFFFSNDHYFVNPILRKVEDYFFHWSNVGFYNAVTGQVEKGVEGLYFANGVSGTDHALFISETNKRSVRQYRIVTTLSSNGIPHVQLDHVAEAKFNMAVDNLHYQAEKELLVVGGHPKPLELIKYIAAADPSSTTKPPSQVDVWDIKTGETKTLIQDTGSLFSTSSSGALDVVNSKLVVSGLYEHGLLVCDM
ncbi:Ubiquitin-conjugating enzyme E2 4 [Mucor velutinosus]|uniref:Ubiquitin-conjugating enzyme E2 4 n=1 Tax=Mucor velutinosus TaxID=708070 RepID=A0AAN7DHF9_9FUNG|nr:Ubiquitin-conjugating enzyme E2 4 [Mucor velutinosus]